MYPGAPDMGCLIPYLSRSILRPTAASLCVTEPSGAKLRMEFIIDETSIVAGTTDQRGTHTPE